MGSLSWFLGLSEIDRDLANNVTEVIEAQRALRADRSPATEDRAALAAHAVKLQGIALQLRHPLYAAMVEAFSERSFDASGRSASHRSHAAVYVNTVHDSLVGYALKQPDGARVLLCQHLARIAAIDTRGDFAVELAAKLTPFSSTGDLGVRALSVIAGTVARAQQPIGDPPVSGPTFPMAVGHVSPTYFANLDGPRRPAAGSGQPPVERRQGSPWAR